MYSIIAPYDLVVRYLGIGMIAIDIDSMIAAVLYGAAIDR